MNPRSPLAAIALKLMSGKSACVVTAATIANMIFVIGPARETNAKSFMPSRRLKGSTGTGLAPPKIKLPAEPM